MRKKVTRQLKRRKTTHTDTLEPLRERHQLVVVRDVVNLVDLPQNGFVLSVVLAGAENLPSEKFNISRMIQVGRSLQSRTRMPWRAAVLSLSSNYDAGCQPHQLLCKWDISTRFCLLSRILLSASSSRTRCSNSFSCMDSSLPFQRISSTSPRWSQHHLVGSDDASEFHAPGYRLQS